MAHVALWRVPNKHLPRYVTLAPALATWVSLIRRSIRPEMRRFNETTGCWEVSVSCQERFWALARQHWMDGLCALCAERRECGAWLDLDETKHRGTRVGWEYENEWKDRETKPRWPSRINNRTDALRVLGVKESANEEEIARAWRKRALRHHPDRGGDHELIVLVNAAYDWLRR